ncbi:2'-5' RNA ligase family protein [Snuella sedimenti]|uniref:2'-5' RNA ligase family protein n=1 Tax=Snuella sedimenti TaxID=2798802 RepID=A0A8J7IXS3_9FLAO|nr:2'-5' RNA ligase family protein [Snuella sedimenti]MBJ6369250.1 2'-5' RNA ligase family protein [Snuella sedimenti]
MSLMLIVQARQDIFMLTRPKIYNLRIVPPEPVYTDVTDFKKVFIEHYGKQPLSASKPHITLAVFQMLPYCQDTLVKTFDSLSEVPEFRLEVKSFGVFDGSAKVLLLKIPMSETMGQLHMQIRILWERDLHRKKNTLIVPSIPHMTISKVKDAAILYKALERFQNTPYYASFLVDHLVLTARPPSKTWDWSHKISLKSE